MASAHDEQRSLLNRPIDLEQIPPRLKTLAIRICSNILIWRESFSARWFHLAGKRA